MRQKHIWVIQGYIEFHMQIHTVKCDLRKEMKYELLDGNCYSDGTKTYLKHMNKFLKKKKKKSDTHDKTE